MNNKGLLIVFSGPSGVGKDSILKELLKINNNIKLSISATTRKKRESEHDGVDYYFLTKQEFLNTASCGGMLEYAEYCGNYYGTPKKPIENWLNQGYDVILEIEVEGGKQIKNSDINSIGVFILPPSLKELEKRLKSRGTDEDNIIQTRLNKAKVEIKTAFDYDYAVINDDIKDCAENINMIIMSEKMRVSNMEKIIKEVLINE